MRVIIIISQDLEEDNVVAQGKVTEAGEGCRAHWMRYRGLFAIYYVKGTIAFKWFIWLKCKFVLSRGH